MSISKEWEEFCDQLKAAGSVLTSEGAPQDPLSQAEGVRYLIRLLRFGTINFLENADPTRPRVLDPFNPNMVCKMGADNPDNIYQRINVSGKYRYRLSGTRGTVPLISFGSKANKLHLDGTFNSTGELHIQDVPINDDGTFSIIASQEKPDEGAWLPISEDTTNILIRQSFQDRATETAAEIDIELLDDAPEYEPIDPEQFRKQLVMATNFVSGTAKKFGDWTRLFMTRPNEIVDWGQEMFQGTGGDPTIYYLHGYWNVQPGEILEVTCEIPDCEYWNFVLHNWWEESLDHDRIPAYLNNRIAKLNDDGTITITIADKDPGYGNWLSTGGHTEGTILLRWVLADRHPIPTTRLIKA